MKLSDYFKSKGKGSAKRLAIAIKAPQPDVSKWAKGHRSCPAHRCVAIEKYTNREVSRKDLHPGDWWLIWPELLDAEVKEVA